MHRSNRDIGGFIFRQQEGFVVAGDLRRATHDDPVLGAVVVLLQRQLFTRFHSNALNLEPVAHVDAVVAAPGPEHFAVHPGFRALFRLQLLDHTLDFLNPVAMGHHQGILGINHHQVVDTHRGHQFLRGMDQAAGAVFKAGIAKYCVVLLILVADVPE